MKINQQFARFLLITAIILAALTATAANQRYIVVLDPHGKLTDKDVLAAGGTIEERFLDRYVVTLPSADALRGNPGVKYVQPIGGSHDLTPPPDELRTAAASRAHIDATPPTWGPMSYSYDAAGNIYAIGGDAYRYDVDSRLTQWTRSGDSSATETYGYDPYGNMTSYKRFDQGSAATISVDAATNHLDSDTYEHGNDISFGTTTPQTTVTYDSLNMPIQTGGAGGTAYYLYTADDERIGVLTGDTWNWSLRGFDHEVLRQFRSSQSVPASPWLWVEDYVYRGPQLLAGQRVPEEGGLRQFHLDHLGTPRLITGNDGVVVSQHDYTPFGLEYTAQNQELLAGFDREEPKRFTGHERDYLSYSDYGSAPDYFHARAYLAGTGRFLTLDRVGGTQTRPQTWNRYTYANTNPTKFVDPNGSYFVLASEADRTFFAHAIAMGTANRHAREMFMFLAHDAHRYVLERGPISHARGAVNPGETTIRPRMNDPHPTGATTRVDPSQYGGHAPAYMNATVTVYHEILHIYDFMYLGGYIYHLTDSDVNDPATGKYGAFERFGRLAYGNEDDCADALDEDTVSPQLHSNDDFQFDLAGFPGFGEPPLDQLFATGQVVYVDGVAVVLGGTR